MRPNVLLVVLDSVRAANTSLHGHANETTPAIERFAERATVYEQARAPGVWSLPSHVSILTGYEVAEHGVTDPGDALAPGHTVFDRLGEAGYATGVFTENPWLTEMPVGLSAAFDHVEGPRNVPFPDGLNPTTFTETEGEQQYRQFLRRCLGHDNPLKSAVNGVYTKLAWDYPWLVPLEATTASGDYVDAFLEWVADRDGPWAGCLNLMDAHTPYEPADRYDEWGGAELRSMQAALDNHVWPFRGGVEPWWKLRALTALYDGAIRQMDAALDRLLSELDAMDALSETLVVVTADHGEGFGEPCELREGVRAVGHEEGINEEQLHVPLVVKQPGQTAARRVSEPATLRRFPAAVEAAQDEEAARDGGATGDGVAEPAFVPDGPVVASSHGLDDPARDHAARYLDEDAVDRLDSDLRAVWVGGDDGVRKYARWRNGGTTRRVYVDSTSRELAADEDRVAGAFENLSDAGVGKRGGDLDEIDGAARDRLEDLGYV